MKKLLLVVDAQNDFLRKEGKLYVPNTDQEFIDNLIKYISDINAETYYGTLFTFDSHSKNVYEASEEGKQFPLHCEYGSFGWQLVEELDTYVPPDIKVFALEKGVFDMWSEDGLQVEGYENIYSKDDWERDEFFEDLKRRNITTVTVIGVCSDVCVKYAIDGLLKRNFIVEIVENLTKGIVKNIETVNEEEFNGACLLI